MRSCRDRGQCWEWSKAGSQSRPSSPGRVTEGREQPGIQQTSSGSSQSTGRKGCKGAVGEPGVPVPARSHPEPAPVINVTAPEIGQSVLGGLRERDRSSVGISVPDFPYEYFMNQLDESLAGFFSFFLSAVLFCFCLIFQGSCWSSARG